ncbi:hypothetical protein [Nocardioides psychrotolerans]|uniref:hypothetical protein n=1 Tax=Nocardioides psychrotolerans TaxID=1005945 RepID=UPI0031380AF6
MITGPQQQRLEKALAGASDVAIGNGSIEWLRCSELLDNVADALEKAAAAEKTIGGQTGPAMAKAFRMSAEGMRGKSQDLARGSEALGVASNAIMAAQVGQSEMNRFFPQAPDPGPYHPQPGPQDDADVTAASDHQELVDAFTGSFNSRENIARQWADRIDTDFAESTKTMQQIHGESFAPPGDSDGPGTSTPPTTSPPPGTRRPPTGGVVVVGDPDDPRPPRPPRPPETETPICTLTPLPPLPPTPIPVVEPLPPVPTPVPTPVSEVPTLGPTGVSTVAPSGGLVGPSIGAIAGGGLAGAALQGIRGALSSPSSAGASAVRPIGSTGRAGAPGALGRGAASPGSATGRGSGARTPGGGAGRGASGGRGAGGRGAAGAGGGAGGRRGGKAAAGAGAAAGRRGGKDKDGRGADRDLFDDGQDWIDDADAAPGVID